MSSSYSVPLHIRLGRALLRPVFRTIFHLISQVQIEGRENIPKKGPYLIAINHLSLFEPPFILAFWPVAPEAVGAVDIWSKPGQSILARIYGGIQVHRGEYDRKLLDTIIAALASGRPVVIAPEGGRSHTPGMRRGLPGVAYVVEKARVPVVPVGISGTTEDFFDRGIHGKRPKLTMRIGQPVWLEPSEGKGAARHESRQRNVDCIMEHIAAQLPEEYHGVYGYPGQPSCSKTSQ